MAVDNLTNITLTKESMLLTAHCRYGRRAYWASPGKT